MNMQEYEIVKVAAKNKLDELRADYEKLKAVDKLIGEEATAQKKRELLAAIMAVQEVQSAVLDVLMRDAMPNVEFSGGPEREGANPKGWTRAASGAQRRGTRRADSNVGLDRAQRRATRSEAQLRHVGLARV